MDRYGLMDHWYVTSFISKAGAAAAPKPMTKKKATKKLTKKLGRAPDAAEVQVYIQKVEKKRSKGKGRVLKARKQSQPLPAPPKQAACVDDGSGDYEEPMEQQSLPEYAVMSAAAETYTLVEPMLDEEEFNDSDSSFGSEVDVDDLYDPDSGSEAEAFDTAFNIGEDCREPPRPPKPSTSSQPNDGNSSASTTKLTGGRVSSMAKMFEMADDADLEL